MTVQTTLLMFVSAMLAGGSTIAVVSMMRNPQDVAVSSIPPNCDADVERMCRPPQPPQAMDSWMPLLLIHDPTPVTSQNMLNHIFMPPQQQHSDSLEQLLEQLMSFATDIPSLHPQYYYDTEPQLVTTTIFDAMLQSLLHHSSNCENQQQQEEYYYTNPNQLTDLISDYGNKVLQDASVLPEAQIRRRLARTLRDVPNHIPHQEAEEENGWIVHDFKMILLDTVTPTTPFSSAMENPSHEDTNETVLECLWKAFDGNQLSESCALDMKFQMVRANILREKFSHLILFGVAAALLALISSIYILVVRDNDDEEENDDFQYKELQDTRKQPPPVAYTAVPIRVV